MKIFADVKDLDEYINANDVDICVNGEEPIDEQYFPEELDLLPVIGCGLSSDGVMQIDLICTNWDKRYEPDWIAEPDGRFC